MSSRGIDHSALRVVRGTLLAVSSAALAVSAHALADGGSADVATTLLLTALIGWTATALAAKAGGTFGTLAVLGTGQLVMHLVLSALVTHSGTPGDNAGVVNGWAMTATHAVATVATALLVARADSVLRAVADAMRAMLPILWRAVPVPAAVRTPSPISFAFTGYLVSVVLRRVHGRRGPPAHS